MMELLTLVYLAGSIGGILGDEFITKAVLKNSVEETGALELDAVDIGENMNLIQENMINKIKSKVNNYNDKQEEDGIEEDDLHSNEKEKNNTGIESQYMGDGNENYVMEEIRIPKVQIYLFEGDAEKNERND